LSAAQKCFAYYHSETTRNIISSKTQLRLFFLISASVT